MRLGNISQAIAQITNWQCPANASLNTTDLLRMEMRLHLPNAPWSLTEIIVHPNCQRRDGARGDLLPMQTAAIKTPPYPLFVE